MTSEIRIRVEGNSGDGFSYIPCLWVKQDEDFFPREYITPLDLSEHSVFCGSKEALIDMATQIIEACKKPCICAKTKIIEVNQ